MPSSHASLRHPPEPEGADDDLKDGDLILICDIGGGTSDFSLVRARRVNRQLEFERTAIGEHLLLGGDNLDSALAHHVEEKLRKYQTHAAAALCLASCLLRCEGAVAA